MSNDRKRLILLSLILALCFVFGGLSAVWSQENDTEEFTLEEITVTAQKREENQQKVPVAMDVISGEDLGMLGRDNVDEILKNVANVSINTASDGMRIALRGIADDSNTMQGQHSGGSTVSVNVDGAFNNMSNAGQNLFDVERVEVLFGPQSTMYGSNSPGGIVNIITSAPKTDKYSGSATLEYGSYNLINLQGVFNAPVIQDKMALRFAANKYSQDPYVEGESDNKTTSARLKALYQATDDFSFELTTNWQKRSSGGMMGGAVKPFADQDGYYEDGTKVTDPWTPNPSTEEDPILGIRGPDQNDQTTKSISANINWGAVFGDVALVPSYSKSSGEGRQTRISQGQTVVWDQERSFTQKGAELRMTNAEEFEWFEWIVGGTWYESGQFMSKDYVEATSQDESRETTQNKKAVYANITYPTWFNEKLKLTLGYRQSWDLNTSSKEGGFLAGTYGNDEGYSKPDYMFGFEYDLEDNLMFYGNFSSSYRSPDAAAMPSDALTPEELDAYTLGAKSRWFGNKLQVNVSAFYYDYANKLCSGFKEALDLTEEDLGGDYLGVYDSGMGYEVQAVPDGQYPTLDTYDLDGDGNTTEAVVFDLHDDQAQGMGQFESFGLDLQTSWLITSKDRLDFSVSYLKAEWKTLYFHYTWYMYWPDEDYTGITPTNSPEWSMTASYQHTFMLGSYGTLTPRIDMQHKTSYKMIFNPTDKDPYGYGYQEPYYLWDVSASFNHYSGRWSLNAYVKNITDYAVKRSYMGFQVYQLMIGDPRTYGASLSVNF